MNHTTLLRDPVLNIKVFRPLRGSCTNYINNQNPQACYCYILWKFCLWPNYSPKRFFKTIIKIVFHFPFWKIDWLISLTRKKMIETTYFWEFFKIKRQKTLNVSKWTSKWYPSTCEVLIGIFNWIPLNYVN